MADNTVILSPQIAHEMLQRMRNDFRSKELFEQLCQDDPTIEARYKALLKAVDNNTDIWGNSSDSPAATTNQPLPSTQITPPSQNTVLPSPITSIWDYRSELLKLYILGQLTVQSTQLQQDLQKTKDRIEDFGNRHRKQKRLSAQQLLDKEKQKSLVNFGIRVANAQLLFKTDPFQSKQEMEDLKKEIYDTENEHHELNMWRIRKIANHQYFELKNKYGR